MSIPVSQPDARGAASVLVWIGRVAGAVSALLGAAVLVGWWVGISALRMPVPGAPPMVPNTALTFVLGGLALILRGRARPPAGIQWAARACAAGMLGIAAATLLEYAAGTELGFDRLLSAAAPGPSAPHTAGAFLLIAVALLVPSPPARWRALLVEGLVLVTVADALLVLIGYLLGVIYFAALFDLPVSQGMAPHTAAGLLVLAIGVLALRPDAAITALLASSYTGGATARRLLPVAFVVIPLTAVIAVRLERQGAWPAPGAVAVAAAASLLALVLAVRIVGRRLDRSDARRTHAEQQLRGALAREELLRARLETILAEMPEGVVVVDGAGSLVLHSEGLHSLATTLDPPTYDVRRPTGEPMPLGELPVMRALTTGETVDNQELLVIAPGGQRVPVLASARPVHAGDDVVGAVAIFRDIRAIKELERLREEWNSLVAHDLRQPVNTIQLTSELLERSSLAGRDHERVQRIRSAVVSMRRMIDDLVDVSGIESGRLALQPQPLEVEALLAEALGAAPELAERCRLRVAAPELQVFADRVRVLQVLGNLVSNADKYGDPESPIVVAVSRREREVEISVQNHGPGIPADELPRLFMRFERTRAARRSRTPGLGLGLYICRGLIEAMGGRIWADSEPGGVTTFHFTLPLASPGAELDVPAAG